MEAERLKKIEEIYHAALEVLPAERQSFLDESCGDDEDLRREVESLIAVNRTSNNIFDTPPQTIYRVLAKPNQPLLLTIPLSIGAQVDKANEKLQP